MHVLKPQAARAFDTFHGHMSDSNTPPTPNVVQYIIIFDWLTMRTMLALSTLL